LKPKYQENSNYLLYKLKMNNNNTGLSESFILGLIASLGALISLIFRSMRKSRCGNISCCYGLFNCKRSVLTEDELKHEPLSPRHSVVDVKV